MKIGIIGAGFTGLAAAKKLVEAGYQVTLLERENVPGGLAGGFTEPGWEWALERHYHHVFTTDKVILSLAKEIGAPLNFYRPLTATYYKNIIQQLDSPGSLLNFSALGFMDRLRTGFGLALLKYNPFWRMFENLTAKKYITTVMGRSSWEMLWVPLFVGKFGKFSDRISATWFWARIYSRSSDLDYPAGGFEKLAQTLAKFIEYKGVRILFHRTVTKVVKEKSGFKLSFTSGKTLNFDRVLCTLPYGIFTKIVSDLPQTYVDTLNSQPGLGAVTLVLALKEHFLPDIYWLNINDRTMPFLAVVEHTNMVNQSHYHGDHLLYIGNYLPPDHRYFYSTAEDLISEFTPYLQKINPVFRKDQIKSSWVWKTPFAQPVFTPGSLTRIPPLTTPIPGLFLAGMQQVYPWDRGINYAVELGYRAANTILEYERQN